MIGLIHYRKGPNKLIIAGVSQPIADASKLLCKERPKLTNFKIVLYMLGPCVRLLRIFLLWGWFEAYFQISPRKIKIFLILAIIRLTAYGILFISWGSNRKYSMLGGHRAVAQILSYEVCLFLIILVEIYLTKTYSLRRVTIIQQGIPIYVLMPPIFITWIIICIAESNRTPFDTAEGESEIVSGFNIEYGGGMFALIFIREYGIILFIRFITRVIFLGPQITLIKTFIVTLVFIWVRSTFPRIRYDNLIAIAWKLALPIRLGFLILTILVV